ncbi:MAG TPA: hypothetical protein VNZ61_04740 [Roseomonas sp.]|nr:hypothetical protein [Roseomonas sp.]
MSNKAAVAKPERRGILERHRCKKIPSLLANLELLVAPQRTITVDLLCEHLAGCRLSIGLRRFEIGELSPLPVSRQLVAITQMKEEAGCGVEAPRVWQDNMSHEISHEFHHGCS